jgi:hypothetical protein
VQTEHETHTFIFIVNWTLLEIDKERETNVFKNKKGIWDHKEHITQGS